MPANDSNSGDSSPLGEAVSALAEGQKVFDRYTLMKIVGRGRMSVAWLAWDETEEHDCCLKFLPDMVKPDASALANLKRAVQRLRDLKHEQIVPTLGVENEGPLVAIVSNAVEGSSISDLQQQKSEKTFSPAELSDWMGQLFEILGQTHEEGIPHGDLRPGNLMVDQKGRLMVTDYGLDPHLVEFVGRTAELVDVSPDLKYLSPQRAAGEAPTISDDIYSIGAVLYQLLTSKPPFYTGNLMLQLEQKVPPPMTHRRKELRVIGEPVSRIWEETVAACLSKDPDQRPQNVDQMSEMLELSRPVAEHLQASSPEPVPRGKPSGLNKIYLAVGGLVFVTIGVAVFVAAQKSKPESQARDTIAKAERLAEERTLQAQEEAAKIRRALEEERRQAEEESRRIQAEAQKKAAEAEKRRMEAEERAKELEARQKLALENQKKRETELERLRQEEQAAAVNMKTEQSEEAKARAAAAEQKRKEAEEVLRQAREEAERLRRETGMKLAEEARKLKEAEAARKAAEAEARQAEMAAGERQKEREEQRRLEMLAKAEAEKKEAELAAAKREEERRKREEQERRRREAELAKKRFAPDKKVWRNSLDMPIVKVGEFHMASIECRIADFQRFVTQASYNAGKDWKEPGFEQDSSHPVVNVSHADAVAFCEWLTRKEKQEGLIGDWVYRLPSDAEWSQVVGLDQEPGDSPLAKDGRVKGVYPWGTEFPPVVAAGNYADEITYDDYPNTAPVGSFRPNQKGIYDLGGNVWEWTADWGDPSNRQKVLRGGSWFGYLAGSLQASYRRYLPPAERKNDQGFRVVLAPGS